MARTAQEIIELIRKTPFKWPNSLIHLFQSGSAMHGATGTKPTDLDVSGVYIQPIDMILGIPQIEINAEGNRKVFDPDVHVWSTSSDDKKNTADDIDLNLYSLRKWANMAATGNTNALEFLFVPNMLTCRIWADHIAPHVRDFISKRAGFHFAEFSKAMLKRLKGEGTGKHGQRDELIEIHGYDTKAAMHLIRVLEEGRELMETGKITLPRPNVELLKRIRGGEFDWPEIEFMYDKRLAELQAAQEKSALPAELDRAKISKIISDAQVEFWFGNNDN
jgi:uncharacterized protein